VTSTSESRSFAFASTPTLQVRNPAGRLHVTSGADGQATVHITKRIHGEPFGLGRAEDLDRVQVHSTQDGDLLRIEVEMPEGRARGVSVDLDLTVPANAALDLRLSAGDLRVRGISGRVRAKTAAGKLEARDVTLADQSSLEVTAGELSLAGACAPGASVEVTINTGRCEIELPATSPLNLEADVDVGAIRVSGFNVQLARTRELVRQRVSGALAAGANGSLRVHVNVGDLAVRGV
jgi:hypothetical protein